MITIQKKYFALVLAIIIFIFLAVLIHHKTRPNLPDTGGSKPDQHGFSIFEINGHTVFSRAEKRRLINILGPDAVEEWSPVSLSPPGTGTLAPQLKEIVQLNKRLNADGGTAGGDATIKVTYRYAENRGVPFSLIRMVFSKKSKKPLLISLKSRKNTVNFISTLEKKYGPPGTLINEKQKTFQIWKKDKNFLITATVPNIFDIPEYYIIVYFIDNIVELTDIIEVVAEKRLQTDKNIF